MRGLALTTLVLVACVGGQSPEARQQSNVAGAAAPPGHVEKVENDWQKAATGHGAVSVPSEVTAHMEKESAPGGNLTLRKPDASAGP
jgi:hypothetical protein